MYRSLFILFLLLFCGAETYHLAAAAVLDEVSPLAIVDADGEVEEVLDDLLKRFPDAGDGPSATPSVIFHAPRAPFPYLLNVGFGTYPELPSRGTQRLLFLLYHSLLFYDHSA